MLWYILTIVGVILSGIGFILGIIAVFSVFKISSIESRIEEQDFKSLQNNDENKKSFVDFHKKILYNIYRKWKRDILSGVG